MNIHRAHRTKYLLSMLYTITFMLAAAAALNFSFMNEFNPGGSNSSMKTPIGAPSFNIGREMYPTTLSPIDFVKQFGLHQAQTEGRYGQGETIGFIEVDGEFSQKAFDAFNHEFARQMPVLDSQPQVTVLPRATDLGSKSRESVVETMVDVEWAHVVAPRAKLIVFDTEKMNAQQITKAIEIYHVNVLSDSTQSGDVFSHARDPLVSSKMASILSLSMSHPYFAGSGDGGENVAPATLYPDAVVVGGIQDSAHVPFPAWKQEGYGKAIGLTIAPGYERAIRHVFWRNVPDVSWFAGPPGIYTATPVGWLAEEGTSLSAPLWAALWALGDAAHREATGLPLPSNANETLYQLNALHPNDFIHPAQNGMPKAAMGLGYPNASLVVSDLGTFHGRVSKGRTFQFYRWPFYWMFLEAGIATIAVFFGKWFRARRATAFAVIGINSMSALLVMIVTSTLCNVLQANVVIRDIAFIFMAAPYVAMIGRLDRFIWNLGNSDRIMM